MKIILPIAIFYTIQCIYLLILGSIDISKMDMKDTFLNDCPTKWGVRIYFEIVPYSRLTCKLK